MNTDEIARLLGGQANVGLPAAAYYEPWLFAEERDLIGRSAFVFAGSRQDFDVDGQFRIAKAFGESLVVVRSGNELRALLNVCRHRGHPVVCSETGTTSRLVCRYHGWAYALDGTCTRPGDGKPEQDLLAGETFLVGDVVLARATGGRAIDPAGRAARLWNDGCERPTRIAHRATWTVQCNWKLFIENFDECYHCPWIHEEYSRLVPHAMAEAFPESRHEALWEKANLEWLERAAHSGRLSDAEPPADSCDIWYGRYPLWAANRSLTTTGEIEGTPLVRADRVDGGFSSVRIAPLVHILLYPDYAFVVSLVPASAETTEVHGIWLTSQETPTDVVGERIVPVWTRIMSEDIAALEAQQRGVRSFAFPSPAFRAEEEYAFRFVSWYRARMRRGPDTRGYNRNILMQPKV